MRNSFAHPFLDQPCNVASTPGGHSLTESDRLWIGLVPDPRPHDLSTSDSARDGRSGIAWASRELMPPLISEAAALFEDGQTVREVAAVLRISKSEAGRLRQRVVEEGLLGPTGGIKEQSRIIRLVPPSQTLGE
jgi:hypothetical protein